jgi:hypothetical protein
MPTKKTSPGYKHEKSPLQLLSDARKNMFKLWEDEDTSDEAIRLLKIDVISRFLFRIFIQESHLFDFFKTDATTTAGAIELHLTRYRENVHEIHKFPDIFKSLESEFSKMMHPNRKKPYVYEITMLLLELSELQKDKKIFGFRVYSDLIFFYQEQHLSKQNIYHYSMQEVIWMHRRLQWIVECLKKSHRVWLFYVPETPFPPPLNATIHWKIFKK